MKIGIVVCTRLKSRRVPNKCALKIAGKTVLKHLHDRMRGTNLPIIYAAPKAELLDFSKLFGNEDFFGSVSFYGYDDDPMARMLDAAQLNGLDVIVRITHDKIFIEPDDVFVALGTFHENHLDYLYSSTFTDGTGFEVIRTSALERACAQFTKVEHISYAMKSITSNKMDIDMSRKKQPDVRLLIDFVEDVALMRRIFSDLPADCTQRDVFDYLLANQSARDMNRMPEVTIYTCAYNAEKYLNKCMGSVASQAGFKNYEYILVNDASLDKTKELMESFASKYPNVKVISNTLNLGLASSSNVALSEARGRYIIRLDADDYFTNPKSVSELEETIRERRLDAVYPNNYFGTKKKIQKGCEEHHPAGAIFSTRALNHIKFTEKLRGFDGLDLYLRAKAQLKIGYFNKPTFFYRQRRDSLSKTNPELRSQLKSEILERHENP